MGITDSRSFVLVRLVGHRGKERGVSYRSVPLPLNTSAVSLAAFSLVKRIVLILPGSPPLPLTHFASSCCFLDEATVVAHEALGVPQEVETLDECLLLVPRPVFDKLKFDETTFGSWDCYAADYCLSAKNLGAKAYVIRAPCSHCEVN